MLQGRYFPQGEVNLVGGTLTPRYYARDHLGSVLQIVNAAGATIAEQHYGDYGSLTYSSGTAPTFGYAGMFQHNQSGLNLTWYRAYDQASGRWLSRDPIEEAGGLNLYGYVGGNPVRNVDSDGRFAIVVIPLGQLVIDTAAVVLAVILHNSSDEGVDPGAGGGSSSDSEIGGAGQCPAAPTGPVGVKPSKSGSGLIRGRWHLSMVEPETMRMI